MVERLEYSFTEFCQILRLDAAYVQELVAHGILEPTGNEDYWYFSATELTRCMKAERIKEDLELNLHGVALALELMDRNNQLRQRIEYLERLVSRLRE